MPLLWLSLAFLAGILLGDGLGWPLWAWGAAGLGALLLAAAERFLAQRGWVRAWRRVSPLALGWLLLAGVLGAARLTFSLPAAPGPGDLAAYLERGTLRLEGVILSDPEAGGERVWVRVRAQRLALGEGEFQPVEGQLQAGLPAVQDWRYGDRVLLTGRLQPPPNFAGSDYGQFLSRQGVAGYMGYAQAQRLGTRGGSPFLAGLYALRRKGYEFINSALPQPEAALLAGVVLGLENDFPPDLQNAFRDTGTAHIVAISGFNIALLSGLFFGLFRRFLRRYPAVLVSIAAVFAYTFLVGAQASVMRAAVMGSLWLLGRELGRRSAGVNSLAFSAACMALAQPWIVWDAGFQLSVSATLGLILYAQPLQERFTAWGEQRLPAGWARRLSGPVGEYFLFTLAAQITTLPVVLVHFQRFSLAALLANPLVLPPQPLVMILGGTAVLAGVVFAPLGKILAWLTWPVLAYTLRVVEGMARLPWASAGVGVFGWWEALLLYVLIFTLGAVWVRPAALPLRRSMSLRLGLAALTAALVLRAAWAAPDGRLRILVLEGSTPGTWVHTPAGGRILINGAPALLAGERLGRTLSPLDPHLDVLLIAQPSADSLQALTVLAERFPPQQALALPGLADSRSGLALAELLQRRRCPLTDLALGERLSLPPDGSLEVVALSPAGAALWMRQGGVTVLWPSGVPPAQIPPRARGPQVLILGEADLREGTAPEDWLGLRPGLVLAPVEAPAAADRWVNTRTSGWVEITAQGGRAWAQAERAP